MPSYNGLPFYLRQKGSPLNFQLEGLDGAELSLYGDVSTLAVRNDLPELIESADYVLFPSDFRLPLLNRNAISPREPIK